jgi:hypothetical protein
MKEREGGIMEMARAMRGAAPADWDHLPDIGLYMDQVVTYLERQLAPYAASEGARIVTPSMINNYVKSGVIGRASAKKYSQSHLALLILVCTLKQVLSIPDLTRLLSGCMEGSDAASMYGSFKAKLALAMDETAERLDSAMLSSGDPSRESALRALALDLAIEAQARSLAARRILEALAPAPGKEKEMPKRRAARKKPALPDAPV